MVKLLIPVNCLIPDRLHIKGFEAIIKKLKMQLLVITAVLAGLSSSVEFSKNNLAQISAECHNDCGCCHYHTSCCHSHCCDNHDHDDIDDLHDGTDIHGQPGATCPPL